MFTSLSTSEAVSDYFLTVLAGLAGSAHMVSATLLALSRLVYEFHGKSLSLSKSVDMIILVNSNITLMVDRSAWS